MVKFVEVIDVYQGFPETGVVPFHPQPEILSLRVRRAVGKDKQKSDNMYSHSLLP